MPDAISGFDAIHAQFRPKVLRYLKGLVGPDEVEDLSQIVFLKVHVGLKNFRGEASLSTWIYRIATNAALDRLRNRSFGQTPHVASDAEAPSDASHENTITDLAGNTCEPSAEPSFIRNEMNQCINTYVDALPESFRTVLALSDLEGFKNRDIAKILGLSVDVVKIRLHRARRELKKQLEAGCDFYRTEANELACDRKAPADPLAP